MKTVELFAGTGSFSKVAQKYNYSTFKVEIDKQHKADLHKDILEVQRTDLPKKIDILWCSPPCTTFSVASLRHYWVDGKPKNAKTWHGISMVLKTLQLIEEIKKDNPYLIWFIENPRGMLRKQDFMQKYHKKTITYCQYGDTRQKPTDIFTNFYDWKPKKICSPGSSCHESAKRGSNSGTQSQSRDPITRAIIPSKLFEEIFDQLNRGVAL